MLCELLGEQCHFHLAQRDVSFTKSPVRCLLKGKCTRLWWLVADTRKESVKLSKFGVPSEKRYILAFSSRFKKR